MMNRLIDVQPGQLFAPTRAPNLVWRVDWIREYDGVPHARLISTRCVTDERTIATSVLVNPSHYVCIGGPTARAA